MYRYVAFAWNPRIEEQQAVAAAGIRRMTMTFPDWECVLSIDGLQVYQTGQRALSSHAYLLTRNNGIVLGTLFARPAGPDCEPYDVSLDRYASQKIEATEGRFLVEQYWGRYVALLRPSNGALIRILRDPTGAIPCQLVDCHGIHVVCSHVADCAALGLVESSINWNHILAFLWFHRLVTRETGLHDVSVVRAGECITVHADRVDSRFYWSPERVYQARVIEEPQQAMNELRQVVRHCVGAWASRYRSILHELSGGLDSAIVLACLCKHSRHARIVALNLYTDDPEGNERIFARKAADRAGVELHEALLRDCGSLDHILAYPKVATPALTDIELDNPFPTLGLLERNETDVLFSGQGGDHFFQRAGTRLIAAEYASRRGLRPPLLRVVSDTARFTKESIWSVWGAVLVSGLLRRSDDPYVQRMKPPPFVSDLARDAIDFACIRHPWLDASKRLPGSKILQILNVADSQNFYRFSSPTVDVVHPLISQPVIECCLQIPCYVLTYGGIDRALVRDAFRELVPPEIIRRTSKGGTTTHVHRQLAANLPFLRETLLDGMLAKQGILDRKATEMNLTESCLIRNPALLFPILNSLRAEVWLRSWLG